jgi:hypothetical protein
MSKTTTTTTTTSVPTAASTGCMYLTVAQQAKGIDPLLLDTMASLLRRKDRLSSPGLRRALEEAMPWTGRSVPSTR